VFIPLTVTFEDTAGYALPASPLARSSSSPCYDLANCLIAAAVASSSSGTRRSDIWQIDMEARFRVRQLRIAVLVSVTEWYINGFVCLKKL